MIFEASLIRDIVFSFVTAEIIYYFLVKNCATKSDVDKDISALFGFKFLSFMFGALTFALIGFFDYWWVLAIFGIIIYMWLNVKFARWIKREKIK